MIRIISIMCMLWHFYKQQIQAGDWLNGSAMCMQKRCCGCALEVHEHFLQLAHLRIVIGFPDQRVLVAARHSACGAKSIR